MSYFYEFVLNFDLRGDTPEDVIAWLREGKEWKLARSKHGAGLPYLNGPGVFLIAREDEEDSDGRWLVAARFAVKGNPDIGIGWLGRLLPYVMESFHDPTFLGYYCGEDAWRPVLLYVRGGVVEREETGTVRPVSTLT